VPHVRFIGKGDRELTFEVGFGSNLFKAAFSQSAPLFNGPLKLLHCRGKGYCGACFVEVLRGAAALPERTEVERKKLRKAPDRVRLACQVSITTDVVVRKPPGILRPRLKPEAGLSPEARRAAAPAAAGEPSAS
jgi:ferredoxin